MSYSAHGWCGARKRQVIDGLAAVRKFVEHGRLGCAALAADRLAVAAVDGALEPPARSFWWSGEGSRCSS